MVGTVFVFAVLRVATKAFASVTGSLVENKVLRGVQEQAKAGLVLKVVQPTLVLSDAELETLRINPVWAQGLVRGAALINNGGFGEST